MTVSVSNPCQQKWDELLKTKKGGFCQSCQTDVIDFTTWSAHDIQSYFKKANHSVCGRFLQNQLTTYPINSTKHAPLFKWVPVSIVSALLMFVSKDTIAQKNKPRIENTVTPNEKKGDPPSQHRNLPSEISGIVRSEGDSSVLPGVNVVIKGTAIGTSTDANGQFNLINLNPSPGDTVVFSFIGFESREISAYSKLNLEVMMPEDVTVLGGAEVIIMGRWWTPRRTWWRIRNLFGTR
jgi:hypothetical protein